MREHLEFTNNPFVLDAPSKQNAVSVFKDWASIFPESSGIETNGSAGLFEDERIHWFAEKYQQELGRELRGATLLELGPLEGGHSCMFDRMGVERVDAIEANAIAYLKCLVAKECLGMPSARFHLGDALSFLEECEITYDVAVCVAFLNHLVDPVSLLKMLSKRTDSIYIWNVCYSDNLFEQQPELRPRFGAAKKVIDGNLEYSLYPHDYGEVSDYSAFWGGAAPSCCWMTAKDQISVIKQLGFRIVESQSDNSSFGEALRLFAVR